MADKGFVSAAELALIGRIGRQDVVVRIEHDHWIGLVFQKRNKRLHLIRAWDGVGWGRQKSLHHGSWNPFFHPVVALPPLSRHCQWQKTSPDSGLNTPIQNHKSNKINWILGYFATAMAWQTY